MDKTTLYKTAKWHAEVALDGDFVSDGRDNLIDTLNDGGFSEFIADALHVYDEVVSKAQTLK